MSSAKPQVLIVGAGVSGLLLAQALKKEGIDILVAEQESSAAHARPREWGMSIQWALPLLADVLPAELLARLRDDATVDPTYDPPDPGNLPTLNARSGELIKDMPLVKVYRVSRRKFRALLGTGIDIQYGKKLKSVTYENENAASEKGKVTAHFDDGSSLTVDHIFGADGARSTVRGVLFGADEAAVDTVPYSAINTHVCYSNADTARFLRRWHPIYTMGIHPAGYWLWLSIQEVPDPADPTTWVFQLQCTWKPTEGEADATSLASLKQRAADFAEPFRTAFLEIPAGTPVYENKMAYWIPRPWDGRDGRVSLIGDAAHPMTFHRGQGLNHCIADVAKLVQELRRADGDIPQALRRYEADTIQRAGDEVALSLKNTHMLHDWDMLLQSPLMQKGAAPAGPPR